MKTSRLEKMAMSTKIETIIMIILSLVVLGFFIFTVVNIASNLEYLSRIQIEELL